MDMQQADKQPRATQDRREVEIRGHTDGGLNRLLRRWSHFMSCKQRFDNKVRIVRRMDVRTSFFRKGLEGNPFTLS